jgi:ABC-type transporter Mla subunit MlaD
MEPISVTASIITVAALAHRICAEFKAIRDSSNNLPRVVKSLNDEIANCETVCRHVVDTLDERASINLIARLDSPLRQIVKQAEGTLQEAQCVLNDIKSSPRSRLPVIKTWRKEQDRLEQLRRDLETIKYPLDTLIGISQS